MVAAVVAAAVVAGGAGVALAWPSAPRTDAVAGFVTAAPSEAGGELAVTGDAVDSSAAHPATDAPVPEAPAAGSGKPGNSGSNSGGGKSASAPTIKSFSTPENIDCHNGNLQHFTAKWSTANAVKVTISIDGPGVYDSYGPSGETSLPFNCSGSHTFLLKAYGADGRTVSKSVTLEPRNAQPAQAPADED